MIEKNKKQSSDSSLEIIIQVKECNSIICFISFNDADGPRYKILVHEYRITKGKD